MDNSDRCLGCMEVLEREVKVCPRCGYLKGSPAREAYHILPGTRLNNRYVIGRVLGYGGFGVTYLAWDELLQQKAAAKEYLPGDFATRIPGEIKVTVYEGERGEQFNLGLQRFMAEARRLAKFGNIPGIVRIDDCFSENGTAYIVMEYLEGETVKKRLQNMNGRMEYEEAAGIILPLLGALRVVHKEGIIHRDISPDNIFLTSSGEVKLLDFGAARYASTTNSKSLSVILKPGYAPEEQYRSKGRQGPWSDIYAVGATIYRMITGKVPEEAMERAVIDTLKPPSKLGATLPKNAENAIMNALITDSTRRTQSVEEMEKALLGDIKLNKVKKEHKNRDTGRWSSGFKAMLVAVAAVVTIATVLTATGIIRVFKPVVPETTQSGLAMVPGVENMTKEEAVTAVEKQGLVPDIQTEFSESKSGTVILQSPAPGQMLNKGEKVTLVVSAGQERVFVPDVIDWKKEDAEITMQAAGFSVKFVESKSDTTAPGAVIRQSVEGGNEIEKGSQIELQVSSGWATQLSKINSLTLPDITGKTYEEAKKTLLDMQLFAVKGTEERSDQYKKGTVIAQNPGKGVTAHTGDIVELTISSGLTQVIIPDVIEEPEAKAISILESAGLKPKVIYSKNDNVDAGSVFMQIAYVNDGYGYIINIWNQGRSTDIGSEVTIYVNQGDKYIMPDVKGMEDAIAKQIFEEYYGMDVQTLTANGSIVLAQQPEAGTEINKDTVISLTTGSPDQYTEDEKAEILSLIDTDFKIYRMSSDSRNKNKGHI